MNSPSPSTRPLSRRTVASAAAWSVPAVAVAVAAPFASASGECVAVDAALTSSFTPVVPDAPFDGSYVFSSDREGGYFEHTNVHGFASSTSVTNTGPDTAPAGSVEVEVILAVQPGRISGPVAPFSGATFPGLGSTPWVLVSESVTEENVINQLTCLFFRYRFRYTQPLAVGQTTQAVPLSATASVPSPTKAQYTNNLTTRDVYYGNFFWATPSFTSCGSTTVGTQIESENVWIHIDNS